MEIEYRDGLLFTEITIQYNSQTKVIDNIVIDTGASHTLISQDEVDDIGIKVTLDDDIITSYGIGGKEHAFYEDGSNRRSRRSYFRGYPTGIHRI